MTAHKVSDATGDIIAYHDRTKHHPERYANGPGGLDWANQPDPFRRFTGAPVFRLPLAGPDDTPPGGRFVRRGDRDVATAHARNGELVP